MFSLIQRLHLVIHNNHQRFCNILRATSSPCVKNLASRYTFVFGPVFQPASHPTSQTSQAQCFDLKPGMPTAHMACNGHAKPQLLGAATRKTLLHHIDAAAHTHVLCYKICEIMIQSIQRLQVELRILRAPSSVHFPCQFPLLL